MGGQKGGQDLIYDCYAVSNHMGGLGGGHYTAYAMNRQDQWHSFNDSSCGAIRSNKPESQVVSSAAYNLFYRRRTWHEQNVKEGCDFDQMAQKPDMSLV